MGNRSSLDVWSDRWTKTPQTRGSDFTGVQRVADLINVERGMWNEEVVERVFDAQSATRVKKIPLLSGLPRDRVEWIYEKSGAFSVQSAYRVAVRLGSKSQGVEASNSGQHRWFWHQLWKSKSPGKSKHLVWRAYLNILPTCANLFQRHIVPKPDCPVCHQMAEDVSHALWGCPYARDVWSLTSPRLQKSIASVEDFSLIARHLFWRLSQEERNQWMTITWAL